MKNLLFILTLSLFVILQTSCSKTKDSYRCCAGGACAIYNKLSTESQKEFSDRIKAYESGGMTCN